MNKKITALAILVTILSSQIVFADSGVVTAKSLNVRQKPSTSSAILGSLSKNTKVTTLGKSGDFYKVNYNKKQGYVHNSYIKVTANSSTPGKTVNTITQKSGQITASSLNIRSGAGTQYPVIGALLKNSKVTLYENTNGFYKINYNGKVGYISAGYVKVSNVSTPVTTPPTTVPVTTPPPTTIPVTTPTQPVKVFTGVGTIIVTSLNVHSSSSMGNNVIGSIYPNKKVNIYGLENGFYKIRYYGQWAYIYKSYVDAVNMPLNSTQYVSNGSQYNVNIDMDNLISYANSFLKTPYLWGGTTPAKYDATGKYISGGFDCSGFTQYVFGKFNVILPRTTMDQIDKGVSIDINNLKKGDLVFFATNTSIPYEVSHVGIYIGDNKFIHSPKTGDVVKISELTDYYKDKFIIGKRIIKSN